MDQVAKEIITAAVTYAVVGFIGLTQAHRFKQPIRISSWILLVIGTVLLGYVLPSASLVSVFGFDVHLNWTLQAFVLGLLAGLVVREIRRRRQAA